MFMSVFVVLQRKGCRSISGPQTVLKASTGHAADGGSVMVNVNSDDCEQPDVDNCGDTSVYSDHLYCKTEAADEQAAVSSQPLELGLKADSMDTALTQPLLVQSQVCYVGTQSEQSDELSRSYTSSHSLGSVCSLSDETCNPESDMSHCPSVMTMQSSDAMPSTLDVTSNSLLELDVGHTEDVSSSSSTTSGMIDTASLEMTSSTIDQQSADTAIDASENSEVVDVTEGRSVELECQCGAQYSDASDRLHVVECQRCNSHQHATCVKYDLTDPLRGNYLCPHCHVIEVCSHHA